MPDASVEEIPSPVSEDFLRAFGSIIHSFALHEQLVIGTICAVSGAELMPVVMLTAEMPYRAKFDTLKALSKAKPLPKEQQERLAWFLGEANKWNTLRNSIAHSSWKQGSRPGSIKPLSLSVRSGAVTTVGLDPAENDYTADELIEIANELIVLYGRFKSYLDDVHLVPT